MDGALNHLATGMKRRTEQMKALVTDKPGCVLCPALVSVRVNIPVLRQSENMLQLVSNT